MNERYETWSRSMNAPPGLSAREVREHDRNVMDEYAAIKREMFIDGFADFVIKQGPRAVAPTKSSKPESWQAVGRRLWGSTHFNEAFNRAIERSRAPRTSSQTSGSSSS